MPEVRIKQSVWNSIRSAALKQGRKPEALANRALREFLQRLEDEELIARSQKAARKSAFPLAETENVIRQYRQRKRGK
jgi:hypothetical protein